jgi:hypothetical protein
VKTRVIHLASSLKTDSPFTPNGIISRPPEPGRTQDGARRHRYPT